MPKAKKKSNKGRPKKVTASKEGGIDKLLRICRQFGSGVEKVNSAKDWNSFAVAMGELKSTYLEYKKEVPS